MLSRKELHFSDAFLCKRGVCVKGFGKGEKYMRLEFCWRVVGRREAMVDNSSSSDNGVSSRRWRRREWWFDKLAREVLCQS